MFVPGKPSWSLNEPHLTAINASGQIPCETNFVVAKPPEAKTATAMRKNTEAILRPHNGDGKSFVHKTFTNYFSKNLLHLKITCVILTKLDVR